MKRGEKQAEQFHTSHSLCNLFFGIPSDAPMLRMHRPMHTLKSDKKEVEQINCVWRERGRVRSRVEKVN